MERIEATLDFDGVSLVETEPISIGIGHWKINTTIKRAVTGNLHGFGDPETIVSGQILRSSDSGNNYIVLSAFKTSGGIIVGEGPNGEENIEVPEMMVSTAFYAGKTFLIKLAITHTDGPPPALEVILEREFLD